MMSSNAPQVQRFIDTSHSCCFCGAHNRHDHIGYGGERCCRTCGYGGDGEPDFRVMAYKGNLPDEFHGRNFQAWVATDGGLAQ